MKEEVQLRSKLYDALQEEEILSKKKSRVTWLKKGNNNNCYFFNYSQGRWNNNKLLSMKDSQGNTVTSHSDISQVAFNFNKDLLGIEKPVDPFPNDLEVPQLTSSQQDDLCAPFEAFEVLNTFKGMAKGKCLGPDGLTVEFYLATWSIVGEGVTKGILYFF